MSLSLRPNAHLPKKSIRIQCKTPRLSKKALRKERRTRQSTRKWKKPTLRIHLTCSKRLLTLWPKRRRRSQTSASSRTASRRLRPSSKNSPPSSKMKWKWCTRPRWRSFPSVRMSCVRQSSRLRETQFWILRLTRKKKSTSIATLRKLLPKMSHSAGITALTRLEMLTLTARKPSCRITKILCTAN